MKRKYIYHGQCIWCLEKEPVVSFFKKAHTVSKKLGSTKIGLDICDSCNHHFGTPDTAKNYPMAIELALKEVMNVMRILLGGELNNETHKRFKSIYFSYYHSRRTIHVKRRFETSPGFIYGLTRQFKKGVYEVFLQEYHRETLNGLDSRFNSIRRFVREDVGDLPLYFLDNDGVHIVEKDLNNFCLHFGENTLKQINDLGFYTMFIYSNVFFLEVTPRAEITREYFLRKESRRFIGSGFIFTDLKRLERVTDIDFTLRKLLQH